MSWRKKKPGPYLPYVATTLNNLGTIDSAQDRLEAAWKEYEEGLKIYRLLAQKNPENRRQTRLQKRWMRWTNRHRIVCSKRSARMSLLRTLSSRHCCQAKEKLWRRSDNFSKASLRLRTNYRLEDVYLYHLIPATPERARALFLDYVKTANELHERAQWYNELLSNCTSNIRLHIKHIGSARPWDWQLLVNGSIDEHAYELGTIDTSLPFAELKRLSHINDRARAADRDPAFSSRIRDGLPGMAIPFGRTKDQWSAAAIDCKA